MTEPISSPSCSATITASGSRPSKAVFPSYPQHYGGLIALAPGGPRDPEGWILRIGPGGASGSRYSQPAAARRSSMSLTAWLLSWYSTAWIRPSAHNGTGLGVSSRDPAAATIRWRVR
jgi:hypothetical protein